MQLIYHSPDLNYLIWFIWSDLLDLIYHLPVRLLLLFGPTTLRWSAAGSTAPSGQRIQMTVKQKGTHLWICKRQAKGIWTTVKTKGNAFESFHALGKNIQNVCHTNRTITDWKRTTQEMELKVCLCQGEAICIMVTYQQTFTCRHISRVGQNHPCTVCIRYSWQGNRQIYGHKSYTRKVGRNCIYTL